MYLCTKRVYNYKLIIILTIIFSNYFFYVSSINNDNKTIQLNRFELNRDQGAILSYAKYFIHLLD